MNTYKPFPNAFDLCAVATAILVSTAVLLGYLDSIIILLCGTFK